MKIVSILIIFLILVLNADELHPTKDEVTKLYVATFNRAPDASGLNYWVKDSNLTLSQIAQSFFDQEEIQSLYPTNISNGEFVLKVYQNLFDRQPDADGWIYWENELNNYKISRENFILAVINGAKDDDNAKDATILENKKEVGLYFANSGLDDIKKAKSIMSKVTKEVTSLDDIYKDIDDVKSKNSTNIIPQVEAQPTAEITKELRWYKPTQNQTWHWQLTGELNTTIKANIYDIDLFETTSQTIKSLQDSGKKVMCYFSAGSFEPNRDDSNLFDKNDLGNTLEGWEDEKWLDIRSDKVRDIMLSRIQLAKEKGCDGVEADNVDGYTNNSGFNLTYENQLEFNKFLADEAHKNGLFIALKNDLDQIKDLVKKFDIAVNEQCFFYNECSKLKPFTDANKSVLNAEYNVKYLDEHNMTILCNQSEELNITTLILPTNLDNSFRYSCDTQLFKHNGVGFGGANAFKFYDNVWVNSADLVFNNLDNDYYNSITDYNLSKFQELSTYLSKSNYVVFWITKGWQESWFSIDKIQSLIDAGYTPVFNYWYFGDELMNGLDEDLNAYYNDAKRVKEFLSKLHGKKLLIMEPEFNKENILQDSASFIKVMKTAIDILKDKETLLSLCMTDTGNRSVNETYDKCEYENCSLGDKYEWLRPKEIYDALLDKLDFISFQEMVGQFSRNPSNPGTWDEPNPIAYSDDDIGINNLATRIDNFAKLLKETYNKPVFLPYITIATATWSDENNDSVVDTDEINITGWEDKANLVYQELNSTNLFGFAPMALFDDPSHDAEGYQFFMQNEYHIGIIKSDEIEGQLNGNISPKKNILENIFR